MSRDLTVIMPLHAGERFLDATLASLASERPEDVKIIAYDSSPDLSRTGEIIASYGNRLDIAYFAVPDLKPWQAKVNRGFIEATTEHVAILHQDDLWLMGHLSAVRAAIAARPEACLSIAPSRFIDAHGRTVGTWSLPFAPGVRGGKEIFDKLIVQNTIAVPSVVYRRDCWLAAGGMDEALWYTPDWDIYLRLAALGEVVVRIEPTTAFRLHGSSLTMVGSADSAAFRDQLTTVLRRHLELGLVDPASQQGKRAWLAVDLNCALARTAGREPAALFPVLLRMARLGPFGLAKFLDETRLYDRVKARLPSLFFS